MHLKNRLLTACTSSTTGCGGTQFIGAGWHKKYMVVLRLLTSITNYYCGDYSPYYCKWGLCFSVNNGTGCTAATQTGTFCMCSDGYLYGCVCGNICGNATNSSKVYKTLANADVARQLY